MTALDLRHFFNESQLSKHIIGFFIILIFVGILNKNSIQNVVINSLVLYIIFIFIMRSPYQISATVIVMLAIMYLLYEFEKDEKDSKKSALYKQIKDTFFVMIIILSFLGFCINLEKTRRIFGKKWSLYGFVVGSRDQECFGSLKSKFGKSDTNLPMKLRKRMGINRK